jgi:hypothetical protein
MRTVKYILIKDWSADISTEKEGQFGDGSEGEGGGQGAESYDRKQAWPSINRSILSVVWTGASGDSC